MRIRIFETRYRRLSVAGLLAGLIFAAPAGLVAAELSATQDGELSEPAKVTFKNLPRDLLNDQKTFWVVPFRVEDRDDALLRAAILGAGAGLLFTDRPVGQQLSANPPGGGYRFSHKVELYGGGVADYSVAGLFWLAGKAGGNERARATGILGVRAVTGAMLVIGGMKFISQRPRPTRSGGFPRIHNADGEFFTGGRSFPSGHAAGAWALGTVVAHQYSHKRWVPPVAYGLAGMVAVSRVTERAHFPADIFIGSAIGFFIGRHVYRSQFGGESKAGRSWRIEPAFAPGGGFALRGEWVF